MESKHSHVPVKKIPFVEIAFHNDKMSDPLPMEVNVRFNRCVENDQEVVHFLKQIETILLKQRSFFVLYDASKIDHVSIDHMGQMAQFLKDHEALGDQWTKGCAIVLSNTIVLNLVKTMLFFKESPFPMKTFATTKEAKDFLHKIQETWKKMSS
jgi:hypothetical protein